MEEREARRLLDEAEGYRILGAHGHALARIEQVESSGLLPVPAAAARGEYHRGRAEHEQGRDAFLRVLAVRPGDVDATVGLGWCLKRLGALPEAVAAYRRALALQPDVAILHYNLGCYLSLTGDTEESLECLERAVRMDRAYASQARDESDFDAVRGDPRFAVIAGTA